MFATSEWHESLRPVCEAARARVRAECDVDVVLFYLARSCQKATGEDEPDWRLLDHEQLRDTARQIVRNLTADGPCVQALVAGDVATWGWLDAVLAHSARRRVGAAAAREYVDEACQKIALVLLTGTPPSRAPAALRRQLAGPRNEYVFASPFTPWARLVLIRMVVDDQRQSAARGPQARLPARRPLDGALVREAVHALPDLLDAIGALAPRQRLTMIYSLCRRDVDDDARDHLRDLAPGLFAQVGCTIVGDDAEIAAHMGVDAQAVRANRSVARRRLAQADPRWALLLDVLMPYRSSRGGARPTPEEAVDGS